jgi:hypothetical protein
MPLDASELDILIDLVDEVRTLTTQTQKVYLHLEAVSTILVQQRTIGEDELRAALTGLDETSADEMSPDRPSVAVLDSVRRRLVRRRRNAH